MNNFQVPDLFQDEHNRFRAMQCTLAGSLRDAKTCASQSSQVASPVHSDSSTPYSRLSRAPPTESSSLASLHAQCTAVGEAMYGCADGGFQTFSPFDQQTHQLDSKFAMPAIAESNGNAASQYMVIDASELQFPSWDQLPEEFEDPTSSANLSSTFPVTTTCFDMPDMRAGAGELMAWDNEEMNFTMDIDMELDMSLHTTGS
ncbi:hypothetical protein ACEQ8H_003184 [Pleosporales sp. CAS-2024a]